MDKLKLLMGRPILVDKKTDIYVHQPTVSDIVDLGEDYFNSLITPFVITTESIFNGIDGEEELIERFSIFDLFFAEFGEGQKLLDKVFATGSDDQLKTSLMFFLKCEDIRFLPNRKKIVVDGKYLIDEDEFLKIRTIIQEVCIRNDVEVEKPPKDMSPRQKDIWLKLQKGRRRTAEKNALYVQDIVNYVQYGGKSYIPYRDIDSMTYYQLQNAYKSIIGVDTFNIGMGYKLSQKFDVKEDIRHWTSTLKIGK